MMPRIHSILILSGFIFLLILTSCDRKEGEVVRINPTQFTYEDQIKIGNFIDSKIATDSNYQVLDKEEYAEAYDYVSFLLTTLLNTPLISHRNTYQWEISIIDNPKKKDIFIVPGGHIYIHTGLLRFIESESQFLSVIGHEIFFTDTDYLINKLRDNYGGVILGDILLENEIPNTIQFSTDISSLSFETDELMLADDFAVALLCPFQYDSKGIMQLLQKANDENIQVDWLDRSNFDINTRIINIEEKSAECGEDETLNQSPYQHFLANYLH